jgi:tetratricopeptide (TPR) repeat protein
MRRAAALLIVPLLACAPAHVPAYDRAFAEGARAESAGRFAEAAAAYDRAAAAAQRARDRDEARWDAAELLVRAESFAEAVKRFDAIAADASSEHQAEAAYRAALMRIEHGDADRGWREVEQVVRRFPEHGIAHAAVHRLVLHADEQGPRAALDELRALERDVAGTTLIELVVWLSAVHLEEQGDDAAARDEYLRIAERWPYPYGAFWDGALWRASLLDEKLGRYADAVEDLRRMLIERETTTFVGTYERAHYVPAMLRMAELYKDRLHDHAKARDTYHRLYATFDHSNTRDDALWLEAQLWREDGDASAACDRLTTLVHDFPDSRYVPCAVAQCNVARPPKSGAPKECRGYITREGWSPKPQ